MTRTILALGVAAVALVAIPAEAQDSMDHAQCSQWRHGHCASWDRMSHERMHRGGYAVGYRFGPSYSYVDVDALPQPIVTRYHLGPHFRYVRENGYVYVINPHSYRVVRVLNAPM